MKRIHLISAFIFLFAAINLTSCDVEPLDPAIDTSDNGGTDTPGGGGTDNGSGGTSSGDYWPAALNNKWTFTRDDQEFEMKMISINSIGGNTYYTFNDQAGTGASTGVDGTATTRLRKSGGNYYLKVDDVVTAAEEGFPGSTTTGSETILLKDNVDVGATWTQTYTQTTSFTDDSLPTISLNMTINGSIVAKGGTLTVGGQEYTNVIESKYVQTYSLMGVPGGTTTTYYYFSKDVGPIKTETTSSGISYLSELVSYQLN
jgi:hypothetical protein